MAANKFATMVHRNTNKFTLILVYALLEWVLIVLLLLNSLFSYLIITFADYFGLKRPCLWCSRLDHFFEPAKFRDSYRSLVCEYHAMEISKLGYCSNHRKLAESQDMCEDCSSSARGEMPNKFVFFPWMEKLGVVQDFGGDKVSENSVVISKCSCCGVSLDTYSFYPDNFLIKPFLGDSENTLKINLILEDGIDNDINEADHSDRKRSGFVSDRCGGKQGIDENTGDEDRNKEERTEENFSSFVSNFDCNKMVADDSDKVEKVMEKTEESIKKDDTNPSCHQEVRVEAGCSRDVSSEIQPQHLEFYIDQDDCHLIPIELMDSKQISVRTKREEDKNCGDEDFVLEFDKHVGTQYELVMEERSNLEEKMPLLPILECEEENIIAELEAEELNDNEISSGMLADFELEQVVTAQPIQSPVSNGEDVEESQEIAGGEMESDNNQVSEEVVQMQMDELEADISIRTEIPDHEPTEDIQSEVLPSCMCTREDPSTSNANDHGFDNYGSKKAEEEEEAVEFKSIRVETSEPVNEIEEDKIPDTPTSVDSLHHLHKKLLLLERRESGTEESLDGSVISDIDAGDGVLTVEKLKSALRAERKALNALYAELEEERSASAVAANQTMAMINRLQEEKAAMQMEALQYQRMMEEQSEYDQEALQLLNELMVKKEKERAELEKELELYRKKVEDYEAREKLMMLKRRKESSTRSATSSASCSNGEDSDGLSVDFSHESKEENGFVANHESSNHNTPVDAVVHLDDSLANFEGERISILEQLKVLEEKLFTLSDEEQEQEQEEDLHQDNGNAYNDHGRETNGVANGHYKEMNGKHHHHQERKHMGAKAKRLLPLFDAIDAEAEDGMLNGNTEEVDSVKLLKSMNTYEIDTKKLAIEEEVDNVYERLQALEADREFLKHCVTSLNKGDKGIQVLQEILHHLRDLRNVELRVRNMEN